MQGDSGSTVAGVVRPVWRGQWTTHCSELGENAAPDCTGTPFPQQYGNTQPSWGLREPAPYTRPRRSGAPLGAVGSRGGRAPPSSHLWPFSCSGHCGLLGEKTVALRGPHRGGQCVLPWGPQSLPPPWLQVPTSQHLDAGAGLKLMPRHGETGPSLRSGTKLQRPFQTSSFPTFCQEHTPAACHSRVHNRGAGCPSKNNAPRGSQVGCCTGSVAVPSPS